MAQVRILPSRATKPRNTAKKTLGGQTGPVDVENNGLVIETFGRHVTVLATDGSQRICHPRGKKNTAVVGDRVVWSQSEDQGTIERVLPRKNLFFRQDEMRTKSFAANLDHILVFLGAEPEFSEMQLSRALIAAEATGIAVTIILNKQDLTPLFERAWARLQPYRDMAYPVLGLSLLSSPPVGLSALHALLSQKITLVLGPSGAGKSTLINQLLPAVDLRTQEISRALNSGKHTTTNTTLYWLNPEDQAAGAIIDSPGFQEFGMHHIAVDQLATYMPDLSAHLGHCKFSNCTHLHEPECRVRDATETAPPQISPNRYSIYQDLHLELTEVARAW